jgi:hypothetical protein
MWCEGPTINPFSRTPFGPEHTKNLIAQEDLQNAPSRLNHWRAHTSFVFMGKEPLYGERASVVGRQRVLNKFYELLLVVNCAKEQVLPTFTKIFTQKVGQECRLICGVDCTSAAATLYPDRYMKSKIVRAITQTFLLLRCVHFLKISDLPGACLSFAAECDAEVCTQSLERLNLSSL